ncbi:hypothetical protein [Hydrogenophaga palleronii]|uniref:hypothetical protein n=1 Tax=Hydrogenophaga palleronii TaxID=65655 RepID=UPI0008241E7B|nr:hypothetical protein [Hydrogenophaga palleronii]
MLYGALVSQTADRRHAGGNAGAATPGLGARWGAMARQQLLPFGQRALHTPKAAPPRAGITRGRP